MHSASRLVHVAALALLAAALSGCATLRVNSYLERGADLTRYRTYNWGPPDTWATGDARLDNNPFFRDRIRAGVDTEMTSLGFEKTTSEQPDLRLHYHASFTQRIETDGIDEEYGYCPRGDCQPYVYEAGTILIDFVDTRSNRVVWRGWAEGSVDNLVDNQQWLDERVDAAVKRIMARVPRRM